MNYNNVIMIILAGAIVMYLMRMLPLVFCKGKIKNKFLRSFLSYVPYAVLTSMTIPEVFSSTGGAVSAVIGFLVAVILAYLGQGLLVVALSSTVVVFIVEQILNFLKV